MFVIMAQASNAVGKKIFPIELDPKLHKSLKHKAIESDQSLHDFILDVLASSVRENSPKYGVKTGNQNQK
jgi:predicted HicB family RNase H-like nuclease